MGSVAKGSALSGFDREERLERLALASLFHFDDSHHREWCGKNSQNECPSMSSERGRHFFCLNYAFAVSSRANPIFFYERFLRGGETTKGLPGGGGLRNCGVRQCSALFCCVSCLGIAHM